MPLLESYNKATEGKAYFEEIRKAKENGQDKEKEAEDNEFAMKSRYICAPQLIGEFIPSRRTQSLALAHRRLTILTPSSLTRIITTLTGHAAVKLKFLLKNKVPAEFAVVYLIVDGINYPITAGNFIDLCQKGVYNQSPISIEQIDFGRKDEVVTFSVIGNSEKDYWVRDLLPYHCGSTDTTINSFIYIHTCIHKHQAHTHARLHISIKAKTNVHT